MSAACSIRAKFHEHSARSRSQLNRVPQIRERKFERRNPGQDIKDIAIAEMRESQNPALKFILTSSDDDSVFFLHDFLNLLSLIHAECGGHLYGRQHR